MVHYNYAPNEFTPYRGSKGVEDFGAWLVSTDLSEEQIMDAIDGMSTSSVSKTKYIAEFKSRYKANRKLDNKYQKKTVETYKIYCDAFLEAYDKFKEGKGCSADPTKVGCPNLDAVVEACRCGDVEACDAESLLLKALAEDGLSVEEFGSDLTEDKSVVKPPKAEPKPKKVDKPKAKPEREYYDDGNEYVIEGRMLTENQIKELKRDGWIEISRKGKLYRIEVD